MKRILLMISVVTALAILAAPAMAVTLPPGTMAASAVDQSSLFYDNTGTGGSGKWEPIATGAAPAAGYEQRTVFSVDAINFGTISNDVFGPYVGGIAAAVPYTTNTLSGLVYDLVIVSLIDNSASGKFPDLFFGPGGRYTNAGGTDGKWLDTYVSAAYGAATSLAGFGGMLVVYEGPTNHADLTGGGGPTGGHFAWVEEGGPASADGALDDGNATNDSDAYPTISHVGAVGSTAAKEPWIIAVFGPLSSPYSPTLVYEGGLAGGWQGVGYANVIGGTYASLIQQDTFGALRDLRLDFTVTVPFTGPGGSIGLTPEGWQTSSLDPIGLHVLPEPATMTLLSLGVAGLLAIGRSRRTKKS